MFFLFDQGGLPLNTISIAPNKIFAINKSK